LPLLPLLPLLLVLMPLLLLLLPVPLLLNSDVAVAAAAVAVECCFRCRLLITGCQLPFVATLSVLARLRGGYGLVNC
jgi:hypothetical protein